MLLLKLPKLLPCQGLRELFHQLIPGDCLGAIVHSYHGDALIHGANEEAERTAHAVALADLRLVLAVMREDVDALMCTILTCDVAKVALNAFGLIYPGGALVQKIEITEICDALQ